MMRSHSQEGVLKQAQLGLHFPAPSPENPVKSRFSTQLKNTPEIDPVCQNTAGLHVIKTTPEPFL